MLILGLIASALAIGAVVYLAIKLTVSFIKNYRKRKQSKIVAADMKAIVKEMAKNPSVKKVSFDDLDDLEDNTIIAEYDEDADELVQVGRTDDVDVSVSNLLRRNNGVVMIED